MYSPHVKLKDPTGEAPFGSVLMDLMASPVVGDLSIRTDSGELYGLTAGKRAFSVKTDAVGLKATFSSLSRDDVMALVGTLADGE